MFILCVVIPAKRKLAVDRSIDMGDINIVGCTPQYVVTSNKGHQCIACIIYLGGQSQ